ncbi:clathrin coat assembly protein AP180 [Carica papaya]|uniref:clathrin coat assembly protein AP180 n=1 Tax=Carica papaya TaxID=3649 RepID=UPI000B8CF5F6|nr:clathrin coat assembly protein AP180 [Carica papaya]
MPSKLRKAIGAVKDQTSISLAKVSKNNASAIEVAILKATTHDEGPIDDRYVADVLALISSNKVHAASCARAIGKRIGRTRNWIVALKSLMLVLRIFQDGDPYFPREVLHAMKRGAKILNLSSFRDDSNSSPWDYTAFVRTFALYLDERLDCFLKAKLQRRYTNRNPENSRSRSGRRRFEPVRDMKPAMLLDKIFYWQRLLDRAIATRPTGVARSNKLVKVSLYAIVQESFDLYKDISDGLALLLDSFFHLHYQSCVNAFQACVRAAKQFEELCVFYDSCKTNGVGRSSEYPSVQKISEELVETLQEFLKDQSSFPATGRSPPPNLLLPAPPPSTSDRGESCELSSDILSDLGSYRTSLEDLMSVGTDPTTSPPMSCYSEPDKQSQQEDFNGIETASNHSLPIEEESNITLDLVLFEDDDDFVPRQYEQGSDQTLSLESTNVNRDCWELVLAESSTPKIQSSNETDPTNIWELALIESSVQNQTQISQESAIDGPENATAEVDLFSNQPGTMAPPRQYNPFLEEDTNYMPPAAPTFFAAFPATPTFRAEFPETSIEFSNNEDDPFAPYHSFASSSTSGDSVLHSGSVDQQNLLQEQQLWLQNQNKIISKHDLII